MRSDVKIWYVSRIVRCAIPSLEVVFLLDLYDLLNFWAAVDGATDKHFEI